MAQIVDIGGYRIGRIILFQLEITLVGLDHGGELRRLLFGVHCGMGMKGLQWDKKWGINFVFCPNYTNFANKVTEKK